MGQLTKQSPKADIERFQLDLEFLGFSLQHFGADGDLGSETRGAAHDAAVRFSLPQPTQDVFPAALVDGLRAMVVSKAQAAIAKPPNFTDLTETAYPGPRDTKVGMTPWEGPLFHTTGSPMGVAGWSEDQINKRWSNTSYTNKEGVVVKSSLKAHFGITQSGRILMIHPMEWFIWHAQQGSKKWWGVEVESFDYGVPGNPKTLPGGGFHIVPINDVQAEAAFELTRWMDKVLKRYTGHGVLSIRTHRQFTDDRDPDIGKTGYQKIMMPLMAEFGISDGGPGFKVGKGRAVPEAWNPAYKGIPY